MKRTKLFTKTLRDAPSDETSRNAQLLIRAGFVSKEMAGVYSWLPLGLKVIENVKKIIREEMNMLNGQELNMSTLQNREIWEKSGRWSDEVVDNWFKTSLKNGEELGLGFSHEEPIVNLMKKYLKSYKDLSEPVAVYQFQNKLRNELRAKSGVMRGREFIMKDLYSFHASQDDLDKYYNKVADGYERIFAKLGIGDKTFKTFASGGSFTAFSHEFQTVCDAGEDWLLLNREKNIAINEEVFKDFLAKNPEFTEKDFEKVRSAETGNIFNFGDKKAQDMGLNFTNLDGELKPVFLASYGIGVTRLVGVLAEIFSDEKGLKLPENIAPYRVYLANLGEDENILKATQDLYEEFTKKGIEVLWDDRKARPGEKFADADLIGIPHRVVISPRTVADNKIEYKHRENQDAELIDTDKIFAKIKAL